LAYLNGSGIEFKLIKDLLTTDPLDSSSEQASTKLNESLTYLVKTTFLKCKFDSLEKTKCYEIHEIIQNEIKEILDSSEKDKILNRVVKTLARSLKNNKSRKNVEKISDHAFKIKDETWQTRKSKSTKNECLINLFLKVGTLNENVVCDSDRAKLGFIELLKLIKDDEILSENTKTNYPQLLGDTLNNLGNLCYKTKEMERALEYYRESLRVKRQSLSAMDVSIGGTLNNMARIYFEKNEFDEALRCYTESYEIYR
jgi:tetratricopeptide (TPR) repeat protein